ncbi:MAG: class I SAM-dependent methyltransferase [Gammaproteobacteria bacterium]|nr:class I SAM-dependent methyltransferase [Gammaproteobacteria bacterium]NNL45572.1 class I SAM-dependent methyltransferase [Woeseiaceae bacterium]
MSDKGYWERHARNYDASLRWVLGRPLPRMLHLASEAVRGREKVLEVASGTGIVTAAIARTSRSIIATDYAAAMVESLERRIQEAGLENVTCEQADIYALPYPEGEFDAVVAANVLHLVPDLPAALQALRRVLRPGGSIIAPTFCHDETWASRSLSRLIAVSGFPGHRRFKLRTLQRALEDNGVHLNQAVLLPGLIPVGYVSGVFEPRPEGWERHQ